MIAEIDQSLERWLRAAVPLAKDVEVHFEQPDPDWGKGRGAPLVSAFLHAVTKATEGGTAGSAVVEHPDGGLARAEPTPLVEARYVVSVWGGSPAVEHELLGRLVNVLATTTSLPAAHLSDGLRAARPRPTLALSDGGAGAAAQLWTSIGVASRPSFEMVVVSPMSAPVLTPVADPPTTMHIGVSQPIAEPGQQAAYAPRRRRLAGEGSPVQPKPLTTVIRDSGRKEAVELVRGADE